MGSSGQAVLAALLAVWPRSKAWPRHEGLDTDDPGAGEGGAGVDDGRDPTGAPGFAPGPSVRQGRTRWTGLPRIWTSQVVTSKELSEVEPLML